MAGDGMSFRRANGDSFLRLPLSGLAAADQLATFNPNDLAVYQIVQGDTLPSIAGKYYGVQWRDMWRIIAAKNNIPNPNNLPVGLLITIPDLGWRIL